MKQALGVLVMLAGCQQSRTVPVAETRPPPAQTAQTPPLVAQRIAEIEFSDWPTATKWPVDVSPHVSDMCGPQQSRESIWATGGGEKRHGPHFKHFIVVRVNPQAVEEFKSGDAPMPVGTVVIKEKHSDWDAEDLAAEYGAMVKREPGYDPQHGDWEYLHVVRQPEEQVTRGRLASCIDCHSHAKDKDYLFRTGGISLIRKSPR